MSISRRIAVIMAGGSGERFWPLSRVQRPKQLLKLASENETLLQEAVSRVLPIVPAENIFVATSKVIRDVICEGDARVPAANVLAEPCKRNTAGCLIWAAASALARYGNEDEITMAVLTADHKIGEHDRLRETLNAAMTAAEGNDSLVTIGIPPTRPDTGYGYIELTESTNHTNADEPTVHSVLSFREKPNIERAQEYVDSKRFYWNSGMFFWRVSVFLRELESANPAMAKAVIAISSALRNGDKAAAENAFESLESISIDFALLEKARSVLVVRSLFPWDDVGSWDSLDRTFSGDGNGNIAIGSPVLVDANDSIVYNEPGSDSMAVAVVGLDNVVVVTTKDGVLVARKDRVQDVRKAVEALKNRSANQL